VVAVRRVATIDQEVTLGAREVGVDNEAEAIGSLDEEAVRQRLRRAVDLYRRGFSTDARRALQALSLALDRQGRRTHARRIRRYMFTLLDRVDVAGAPDPSR
jgi:hypothetical protein